MNIKPMHTKRILEKAFTLVELLVVISIIALMLSILLPSLGRARELTKRVICASNTRQLLLGIPMYIADNDDKMPYHCNADSKRSDTTYEPYKTYSLHHATIPVGDLIQGLGRLYHSYVGDNLKIYFCPGMRNTVCAFPRMPRGEPYNPDPLFQLENNQWIGTEPFRMPNRACYMYRAGDFDKSTVHPLFRKLTLRLSNVSGQRGLISDIWSMAGDPVWPVIAHKEGINVGFVDGHSSWNRVDDFSICVPDFRYVISFWDIIDKTMN